jgi:subtilase family serine protease
MKMFASVAMATGILAYGASVAAAPLHPSGAPVQLSGGTYHVAVCAAVSTGYARCGAHIVTNANGLPLSAGVAQPHSLFGCQANHLPAHCVSPDNLRHAYNITGSGSSSTVVAIVDAFGYPNAASDLAAYRAQFGLPPCTVASGCLRIINQNGGTTPPVTDGGWDVEQGLDLDMVSAMCPNCRILLVQATTNSGSNLAIAVNQAALQGAHVISNSYGGGENGSQSYEPYYNHPGVAITASTGDSGYGAQFPATSPHVTAVGGTTLNMNDVTNTVLSENVWAGAGSGCSAVFAAPYWQAHTYSNMSNNTLCTMRMEADVSADADPNTGALVYYNIPVSPYGPLLGFYVVGGTSEAAPIIGGIYGERHDAVIYGSNPYKASSSALHDITSGSNGSCPAPYWCHGEVGYDGPTGLGSPNGDTAF